MQEKRIIEEMQMQVKMKELELEQFRLSVEKEETVPLVLPSVQNKFDMTKYIRFVPPFLEKEVDKYFVHYEKMAKSLAWPNEYWTLLLQSVLIGKAHEIYRSLDLETSSNYNEVKRAILKAYELVPEL